MYVYFDRGKTDLTRKTTENPAQAQNYDCEDISGFH